MGIAAFLRQICDIRLFKSSLKKCRPCENPSLLLNHAKNKFVLWQPYYFSYPTILSILLCVSFHFSLLHSLCQWLMFTNAFSSFAPNLLALWLTSLYFFHSNPACIHRITPQPLSQESKNEWGIRSYSRVFDFSKGSLLLLQSGFAILFITEVLLRIWSLCSNEEPRK